MDDIERIERILALFQALVNVTVSDFSALAPFMAISEQNNYANITPPLLSAPLLSDVDILSVVSAVHPRHDVAINSFDPAYNDLPIKQVITERGICYTLNAPLSRLQYTREDGYVRMTLDILGLDYINILMCFISPSVDPNKDIHRKPIECTYAKNQCYMKIDTYESTMSYLLHSPYELATSDVQFAVMDETDELVASYMVLETVASDRLRDLSVKQRSCVFHDENYQGFQLYSYNLCVMRCRAAKALEFCHCKPHFYPFIDGPACTIDGLRCLAKHPSWHDKQPCRCLKPCTEIVYYVMSATRSHWATEGGIPFKQKASFRWEMIQPKTRLRRDVLFTFEDLLVSFGGGIALFVGKDMMAFAEFPIFLITEALRRAAASIQRRT
nr:sodium channel protein Nach-like [Aedes albopictus]